MKGRTVLLDTNAYSRLMQGEEFVIRVANEAGRVLLCSVVLGELEAGFCGGNRYEQNKKDLNEFCSDQKVEKVFSSEKTSIIYGELMSALRRAGTKIPVNDVWIGAFAKEYGAVVFSFDHHMKALLSQGVECVEFAEASHA